MIKYTCLTRGHCASNGINRWPRYRLLVAVLALIGVGCVTQARAQGQSESLPANVLAVGEDVDPTASWNGYYQPAGGDVSPAISASQRDPRIVNLARALRYDVDNIYAFVHDNILYEPLFGLKKGAYGAIVDKSGTAFDQAQLMIELLRESGYSASYIYGTVTPSKQELEDWLGLTNLTAEAAQKIFSDGGIPAVINGAGSTISSTEIAHIWVKVNIGGTDYLFDPAFKSHVVTEGAIHTGALNLGDVNVTGYTESALLSAAAPSPSNFSDRIESINATAIESNLKTYATNLANHLKQNYFDASLEDIIGGKEIIRTTGSTLRQTSHPLQGTVFQEWNGEVPFVFRTKVIIAVTNGIIPTELVHTFYSEELSGRRIAVTHDAAVGQTFDMQGISGTVKLEVDGAVIEKTGTLTSDQIYLNSSVTVSLDIDHPYAGNSGAYMDRDTSMTGRLHGFFAIVVGFGHVSQDYANEVERFVLYNDKVRRLYYDTGGVGGIDGCSINGTPCNPDFLATSANLKSNLQTAATWLAETSDALSIQARMLNGIEQRHHSIGVVGSIYKMWLNGAVRQESNFLDIESAWSFNNVANDAAAHQTFYHAFGGTISALEASVTLQQQELPDPISTNAVLRWFTQVVGSGKLYNGNFDGIRMVTSSNFNQVKSKLSQANHSVGTITTIEQFTDDGYVVLVNSQPKIGPAEIFHRDTTDPDDNYSNGAVILAYHPTTGRIAHLLMRADSGFTKGGGGIPTLDKDLFPGADGEFLEDQFKNFAGSFDVDLKSGDLTLTPPPDLTIGDGDFPYSLSFQRTYSTAIKDRAGPLGLGWRHNFDIRLNIISDSSTFFGKRSPIHAASTIAAFYVMQDMMDGSVTFDRLLTNAIVQDWWGRQAFNNAVTVHRGNESEEFARLPDGTYMAQTGSVAKLEPGPTGVVDPIIVREERGTTSPVDNDNSTYIRVIKGYKYFNVSFTYTLDDRSEIDFAFQPSRDISQGYVIGGPITEDELGKLARHFRPTEWRFPFGVDVTFTYEPGVRGVLLSVANNLGRQIDFNYSSANFPALGSISDNTGRTVSFAYTALDDLDEGPGEQFLSQKILTGVTDVLSNTTTYEIEEFPNLYVPYQIPSITNPVRPQLKRVYLPSDDPQDPLTAFLKISYDEFGRVEAIADAEGKTQEYFIGEGVRGESVDPVNLAAAGAGNSEYYDTKGRLVRIVNALGDATTLGFDGLGRLILNVMPLGDSQKFDYDTNHNRIRTTNYPRPDDPASPDPIIIEKEFDEANFPHLVSVVRDGNCMAQPAAQRTDCQVTHTYDVTTGLKTQTTGPLVVLAGGGSGRPITVMQYNGLGQLTQLTDAEGLVTTFSYDATHYLDSVTVDPGALGNLDLVSLFDYDSRGNLTSVTDPRGFVTGAVFDDKRRILELHQPENAVAKWSYDIDGLVASIQEATNAAGTTFRSVSFTYYATGRAATITDFEGKVSKFYYDAANRKEISVDAEGRKTRTVYDPAGQTIQEIRGYQWDEVSALPPASCVPLTGIPQCFEQQSYDANGNVVSITDANNNVSELVYDGFNRVARIDFPSKSASSGPGSPNVPDGADFEDFAYDANGNRIIKHTRKRETIRFAYDYANRNTRKVIDASIVNLPLGGAVCGISSNETCFDYDLKDRLVRAKFANTEADMVSFGYDKMGRLGCTIAGGDVLSINTFAEGSINCTKSAGRVIHYRYDELGNRTEVHYPESNADAGNPYFASYFYDGLGRLQDVTERGGLPAAGFLNHIIYSIMSERTSVTYGSGISSTIASYYADSTLNSLTHDLMGSVSDVTYTFAYNAANQVTQKTITNSLYVYDAPLDKDEDYAVNGLNQYPNVTEGGAVITLTYDANGSLTGDGIWIYTYDVENRLLRAERGGASPRTVSYDYDPLGRRIRKCVVEATVPGGSDPCTVGGVAITEFLTDGDELLEEYDNSGDLLRRYIYGSGIDERIAALDYSSTPTPAYLFFHTDQLGSVVALSDISGDLVEAFTYSPYGAVNDPSGIPFRFTGRYLDAETGLYYYRARYYSAALGRFLQTDPIGYQDDINLYSYAANDPVNITDPSGTCSTGTRIKSNPFAGAFCLGTFLDENSKEGGEVGEGDSNSKQEARNQSASQAPEVNDELRQRLVNILGFDPEDPDFHYYEVFTAICYLGNTGCADANVSILILVYPSPGRFGDPVSTGDTTNVSMDPVGGLFSFGMLDFTNPVRHEVIDSPFAVLNLTLQGHGLFPGGVARALATRHTPFGTQLGVFTVGTGTGGFAFFNRIFGPTIFGLMDQRIQRAFNGRYNRGFCQRC